MSNLGYGVLSGMILGIIAAGPMFKMAFPDKRAAIAAAFIERFSIGVLIPLVALPWPSWVIGIVFGFVLSLPSALITKATLPILAIGTIGGFVIGLLLPLAVR
jgi:hypothetical protein